jgi:transcriptional regulator with XRE-family HTH domain
MSRAALMKVGPRLRMVRKWQPQTVETVAKTLRISAGTIYGIEQGKTIPSLSLLYRLAEHYGVDIKTFFDDGSETRSDAGERFVRRFGASLNVEDWDTLSTVAAALAKKRG